MNIALILAGGIGTRVGSLIPKQFIKINDKEILAYTIDVFQKNKNIDYIQVVCHKDWVERVSFIKYKYDFTKIKWICVGGSNFQKSVFNGLKNLTKEVADDDNIVISFGVSPLTTSAEIDDSIFMCNKFGNGISAADIPLCTCIKDDELSSTQNFLRERLKGFGNPWTFKYGELISLYNKAERTGVLDQIEPHTTSLYFYFKRKLWFSKSESPLIKITTKKDLDLIKIILTSDYMSK